MKPIIIAILLVLDIGFGAITIPAPSDGTTINITCPNSEIITISSAYYGLNCKDASNFNQYYDQTSFLASKCNDKPNCSYRIWFTPHDPAPSCPKSYVYSYRCSYTDKVETGSLWYSSYGTTLNINCTDASIDILSAIFGSNCATSSSQTSNLGNACNFRQNCSYAVLVNNINDPDIGCSKTYDYRYQCVPITGLCQNGSNYFIGGNTATAQGDPHFQIFNGNTHNYQGNSGGQYYYMHPCPGSHFGAMPFTLLASHITWIGKSIAINYITLELYDIYSEKLKWVVYLNYEFAYLADYKYGTVYNPANVAYFTELTSNTTHSLPHKEIVIYYYKNTVHKTVQLKLSIGGVDTCVFELSMQQQLNDPKPATYFLTVPPPDCYKCFTCGLFGSFQKGRQSSVSSGKGTLLTCDGGYYQYQIDLMEEFSTDDYDRNGWTWEKSYVDTYCANNFNGESSRRRRLQGVNYIADQSNSIGSNGEYFVELYDSSFEPMSCNLDLDMYNITNECESVIDDYSQCCSTIGGKFCAALKGWCKFDTCIFFQETNSPLTVDDFVYDFIAESLDWHCNKPDLDIQYNDDDLVEISGAPDWYIKYNTTTTQPTPKTTEIVLDTTETDNAKLLSFITSLIVPVVCFFKLLK
eukprot:391476_1